MDMFAKLRENLKTKRRTIVFTEGPDPRILEATFRLKNENLMDVILVGNESEVRTAAANHGFDISGVKAEDITAAYDNGVLTLNMPKREATVPTARRLEIQ